MRLKKNDVVKVIAGKEKGKSGKIDSVDTENERVYVLGVNMVSKTMKKRNAQDKGGLSKIEAPIHVSNVALVVNQKTGETSKVGYKVGTDGKKVRFAKKTGETV